MHRRMTAVGGVTAAATGDCNADGGDDKAGAAAEEEDEAVA